MVGCCEGEVLERGPPFILRLCRKKERPAMIPAVTTAGLGSLTPTAYVEASDAKKELPASRAASLRDHPSI